MASFKGVMSQAAQVIEHSSSRRLIVKNGWRPHPSVEEWQGDVVDSTGKVSEFHMFGSSIQKQLCRMVHLGQF